MNMQKVKSTLVAASLLGACAHDTNSKLNSDVSGKIYVFKSDMNGFDTKTIFFDDGEEVVAFDAQFTPDLAKASLQFLRERTKNPVSYVVVTHPNADKFNGLSVYKQEGATIVASKQTADAIPGVQAYKKYYFVNIAKMFTDASYPTPVSIDQTFDGNTTLTLKNGASIFLQELAKPGISSTQTVAFIPGVNALIVGDLIHHKAHAWLEGGIVNGAPRPEIDGWRADLKEIESRYSATNPTVYGGRGEDVALAVAIPAQLTYLDRAEQIVSDYIAGLGDRRGELKTDKANAHYQALEQKFAQAFPDYQLSYMIGYGVYGLVNQLAQ